MVAVACTYMAFQVFGILLDLRRVEPFPLLLFLIQGEEVPRNVAHQLLPLLVVVQDMT